MALDQSALLEILEMMRSADDGELMRRLLGTMDASAGGCRGDRVHRRRAASAQRGPHDPAQRHPRQDRHHRRGRPDGEDLQGADRVVLPALLSPRRRIDVALAVVMHAYVEGVSFIICCRSRELPAMPRPSSRACVTSRRAISCDTSRGSASSGRGRPSRPRALSAGTEPSSATAIVAVSATALPPRAAPAAHNRGHALAQMSGQAGCGSTC
jgi:hypothetical protein